MGDAAWMVLCFGSGGHSADRQIITVWRGGSRAMSHPGARKVETEEREERGSGRSQNVVHTLPRSMASVPSFLTGPLERVDPAAGGTQVLVITPDTETALGIAEAVLRMTGPAGIELLPVTSARRAGRLMAGRPVLAAAGTPGDIRD